MRPPSAAADKASTIPAANSRRLALSLNIDIRSIDFQQTLDSNYRARFEYAVRVYNPEGDQLLNSAINTVSPILVPPIYQSMRTTGANAHLDIAVRRTGDSVLRVAVHDLTSDRVGAIEIPVSSTTSETP